MRSLKTEIPSEKCIVRRFRRCANVIECTYTNLDSVTYYTLRLYGIVYCYKPVQYVTVLNTVGKCNTMVSIIILYYIILYYIILYYNNLMEPPSYMRSVVDRNVAMQRILYAQSCGILRFLEHTHSSLGRTPLDDDQ
jgi:hypothetical protein